MKSLFALASRCTWAFMARCATCGRRGSSAVFVGPCLAREWRRPLCRGAFQPHQHDAVGASLVDQQVAARGGPHRPDDAGIDAPRRDIGQFWKSSGLGLKRTRASGLLPDSLYQTMPSTTARGRKDEISDCWVTTTP